MMPNRPQSASGLSAIIVFGTRLTSAAAVRIVAVVGLAIATLGLVITAFSPPATQLATGPQPCVDGVVPLNPYIINCNLPQRQGDQVVGAAPDAGAIIACRHNPACLAWYVNYPGAVLVPGYRK